MGIGGYNGIFSYVYCSSKDTKAVYFSLFSYILGSEIGISTREGGYYILLNLSLISLSFYWIYSI